MFEKIDPPFYSWCKAWSVETFSMLPGKGILQGQFSWKVSPLGMRIFPTTCVDQKIRKLFPEVPKNSKKYSDLYDGFGNSFSS